MAYDGLDGRRDAERCTRDELSVHRTHWSIENAGYDALQDRIEAGYLDSRLTDGTDHARASRIGTNSHAKSEDIGQIIVEASEEFKRERDCFDCEPEEDDDETTVAWMNTGKHALTYQKLGIFMWARHPDTGKYGWFTGGHVIDTCAAGFEEVAKEYDVKAAAASGAAKASYQRSAAVWRSPDKLPSFGHIIVFAQTALLEAGGDLPANVFCKYGVDAVAHASSGKTLRDFVIALRDAFITKRNDWMRKCKASGKCRVKVQARGPHCSRDKSDGFYTEIYDLPLPKEIFEGKKGASKVLAGDIAGWKEFIDAVASKVPGPKDRDRATSGNVADFFSLNAGTSAVLFGCDVRYSFDDGATSSEWLEACPGSWPDGPKEQDVLSFE